MKVSVVDKQTGKLHFDKVIKVEDNMDGTVTITFASGEEATITKEEAETLGLI